MGDITTYSVVGSTKPSQPKYARATALVFLCEDDLWDISKQKMLKSKYN